MTIDDITALEQAPPRFADCGVGVVCTDPDDPLYGVFLMFHQVLSPGSVYGPQPMLCPTSRRIPEEDMARWRDNPHRVAGDGLCECASCVAQRFVCPT